jgi:hypothetical protein
MTVNEDCIMSLAYCKVSQYLCRGTDRWSPGRDSNSELLEYEAELPTTHSRQICDSFKPGRDDICATVHHVLLSCFLNQCSLTFFIVVHNLRIHFKLIWNINFGRYSKYPTCCIAEGTGFGSRHEKKRFFCSPKRPDGLCDLTSLLYNYTPRVVSTGQSDRGVKVKNDGAIPPLSPYIVTAWCLLN